MRPTQSVGIHLETIIAMTPYLPGDIPAAGSDGLPGKFLQGISPLFPGQNRLADFQIGRFRNLDGLLRNPGNPFCTEGREIRIAMNADA